MKIIRNVIVKQILTENRKQELMNQLLFEKQQLQKELEQLKFQLHKKLKTTPNKERSLNATRTSFQKEMNKREEKIAAVDFKMHQLNKLEIGTELKDGTVQTIEEIHVGDDWEMIQQPAEIIIKDGKIHEIRKGRFRS